jgi:hypothetical protein
VNHKIRTSEKLDVTLVARMVKDRPGRIPEGLVIRDVGYSGVVGRNAIADRGCRMIQVLRFNEDVADSEKSFFELGIVDAAREILKLYGKIGVLHLPRERILEAALECCRSINIELGSGKKCGREKREPLNMVPMCMANEEMNPMGPWPAQHVKTENADSRTAIENKGSSIVSANFNAGSVAAIDCGSLSRGWD